MVPHFRILTLTLVLLSLGAVRGQGFAPMDTTIRKNELSVDVTGFIRQFVPNNSDPLSYPYNYQPTYLLAYKRGLGNNALRFGLGGNYALDSD
ncbi:MAG: hypothetical protein M3R08_07495, partial [Bacteroidota bacterium]|nr:hypothetical protein [Bacteroidota bacterium]